MERDPPGALARGGSGLTSAEVVVDASEEVRRTFVIADQIAAVVRAADGPGRGAAEEIGEKEELRAISAEFVEEYSAARIAGPDLGQPAPVVCR